MPPSSSRGFSCFCLFKTFPIIENELPTHTPSSKVRYISHLGHTFNIAEALIELGEDLDTARQLINRVRQRAMNSAYVKDFNDPTKDAANYKIGLYPAAGWTQEYARKALRTEMRLEKALEGERYFDLVRWGIAKEVMTKYFEQEKDNRVYYQNAQFNDGEEYFPIPVAQYNFSLGRYTQNPGYPKF